MSDIRQPHCETISIRYAKTLVPGNLKRTKSKLQEGLWDSTRQPIVVEEEVDEGSQVAEFGRDRARQRIWDTVNETVIIGRAGDGVGVAREEINRANMGEVTKLGRDEAPQVNALEM